MYYLLDFVRPQILYVTDLLFDYKLFIKVQAIVTHVRYENNNYCRYKLVVSVKEG